MNYTGKRKTNTSSHSDWMARMENVDVSLSELRELVMYREAWSAAIHGVAKSRLESNPGSSLQTEEEAGLP